MTKKINLFANLKSDIPAGLVVFLVALPLCLGIALASGAPPLSGIISGVVGGIIVGYFSNSHLSVSGPAAGLTAIVLAAITDLGAFNIFLTAGLIAGLLQLILGYVKAGSISNYFPTNVIEGMLAGIGVIIILKQIPHALGYDFELEGDESFFQVNGGNIIDTIGVAFNSIHLGAITVTLVSLTVLLLWTNVPFLNKLKLVPGALVAVIISIVLNEVFISTGSSLAISSEHLVSLPIPESIEDFKNIVLLPDFNAFLNYKVWVVGATIAIVASIETLLCIEAADRMDVQKRLTDTNVELKAQGIGNIVSSILGGLPLTSVVVRTSTNNSAGAKSKMSAIVHGVFLLLSVLAIPFLLNKIPFATLAAVLFLVGYKLAKPSVIKHFWHKGKYQFMPFIATLVGVVFLDLLKGVALGILISVIFIVRGNMQRAYRFRKDKYEEGDIIRIDLAQEVSFLNKAAIKDTLNSIPENSRVIINAQDTVYIAHDVLDLINDFKNVRAKEDNIKVMLIGFKKAYEIEEEADENNHVFFEKYQQHRQNRLQKQKQF